MNYDGTDFAFLESPVFLILIALAAAVSIGLERRGDGSGLETGTLGAFYGGVAHVDVGFRGLVRRMGWQRAVDALVGRLAPRSRYLSKEKFLP